MFSPCSQGVSSTKNPNRKRTCKRTEHSCPSLTKTDGSLHLVPGRVKATHCSSRTGGRTVRDGINAEAKFTNNLRRGCVCVSCVASMYSRVLQYAVCRLCD